eukprot:2196268-Pyramimonas_sp.AAC.1
MHGGHGCRRARVRARVFQQDQEDYRRGARRAPPHAKAAMPDVTHGGQMQMRQNVFGGQLAAALFAN